MVNKIIKNIKKDSEKNHVKETKIFLKKKKTKKKKTKKGPRKFTEENKEKGVSIIRNVRRSYLTIEEIII